MYDSKPKEREGEAVESLLPEAISSTASSDRQSTYARERTSAWPPWVPEGRGAFIAAAAAAGIEAFALVLMLLF